MGSWIAAVSKILLSNVSEVGYDKAILRGLWPIEGYAFYISAASCSRSHLYASYESYVRPLSYGVWQIDILPEAVEWQTKK